MERVVGRESGAIAAEREALFLSDSAASQKTFLVKKESERGEEQNKVSTPCGRPKTAPLARLRDQDSCRGVRVVSLTARSQSGKFLGSVRRLTWL